MKALTLLDFINLIPDLVRKYMLESPNFNKGIVIIDESNTSFYIKGKVFLGNYIIDTIINMLQRSYNNIHIPELSVVTYSKHISHKMN